MESKSIWSPFLFISVTTKNKKKKYISFFLRKNRKYLNSENIENETFSSIFPSILFFYLFLCMGMTYYIIWYHMTNSSFMFLGGLYSLHSFFEWGWGDR